MIGDLLSLAVSKLGAIITHSLEHEMVGKGNVFSCINYVEGLAAGSSLEIVLDPTAFSGAKLSLITPHIIATSGPVTWETYVDITANDDGTICDSFNRNINSAKTPDSIIRLNPTGIVTNGGPNSRKIIPGSSAAVFSQSGSSQVALPIAINPTIKYLLKLTNRDTNPIDYLEYNLNWFEVI